MLRDRLFLYLLLIFVIATAIVVGVALYASATSDPVFPFPSYEELQNQDAPLLADEKTRLEILELQSSAAQLANPLNRITPVGSLIGTVGTFVTALTAGLGILLTLREQLRETRKEREQEQQRRTDEANQLRQERQKEREQREREIAQRFDEQFKQIVKNLGSERPEEKVGALVSLRTYLGADKADFHDPILDLLLATLRLPQTHVVNSLLKDSLQSLLPLWVQQHASSSDGKTLDLAEAQLEGLSLRHVNFGKLRLHMPHIQASGMNLHRVEVPRAKGLYLFQARLERAQFTRCNLEAPRLAEVEALYANFAQSRIFSAEFTEAQLQNARFNQARLQSSRFFGADLRAADFTGADINACLFDEADLDHEGTLRSLVRAKNWQKARFDGAVRRRLEELAQEGG